MPAPTSFDRDLMTEWSRWVLDHGLPALPDGVVAGESIPVARWIGGGCAAVFHAQEGGDETQVFLRVGDEWELQPCGGGGERTGPAFGPSELRAGTAELNGELGCSHADGSHARSVDGVAVAAGPVVIELARGDEIERQPVESSTGVFVAAWTQLAGDRRTTIVRVVDDEGRTLTTASFPPL